MPPFPQPRELSVLVASNQPGSPIWDMRFRHLATVFQAIASITRHRFRKADLDRVARRSWHQTPEGLAASASQDATIDLTLPIFQIDQIVSFRKICEFFFFSRTAPESFC